MLTLFRIAFGSIATLKAISLIARSIGGDGLIPGSAFMIVLGFLMAAASACLALGYRPRLAAGTVFFTGVIFLLGGMYNHHLYLLVVIALILTIGIQVELLLKIQLTIVYTFAVLTKINDGFLSGTELHVSMVERSPLWGSLVGGPAPAPLLITVSVAAVVAEAFLVFGFWFQSTRALALIVGIGLHGGMLVLLADTPMQTVNLIVYGTLMGSLYLSFFADKFRQRPQTGVTQPAPLDAKDHRAQGDQGRTCGASLTRDCPL